MLWSNATLTRNSSIVLRNAKALLEVVNEFTQLILGMSDFYRFLHCIWSLAIETCVLSIIHYKLHDYISIFIHHESQFQYLSFSRSVSPIMHSVYFNIVVSYTV